MCSVVGCDSWRRRVHRFKLPEDPERRLEWVQFLLDVNGQRLNEKSWTDITVCREHFTENCFKDLTPTGTVGLKPSAVPSLCIKSEPDSPEPDAERPKQVEECVEAAYHDDQLKQESPTHCSEETETTFNKSAKGGSSHCGVSCSADKADCFTLECGPMLQSTPNIETIKQKAALLQTKGKYVVNEKHLFQLFPRECPLCGSKVKLEKFMHGLLIVLKQQCLQCEFRNQWKSQVNASIPEDQHLTGGTEINLETPQAEPTDGNHSSVTGVSEINAATDEESDPADETEPSAEGDMDSDEEWRPTEEILFDQNFRSDSDEDSEHDIEEEGFDGSSLNTQLCTECGVLFSKRWPHTCEHKTKPFSCNICGKRCVNETALNAHGRIHDASYEFRCKYCNVTFKTKADKLTHEQSHLSEGKPYKCPECSEIFASRKERNVHLEVHKGPRQLKCRICGIEFYRTLSIKRHMLIHTGVKPYKCSVCQRGFNQASHLKSHMRLHTGERPFKCQHCDKSFNHKVSLKSHVQRYHTGGIERNRKRCPDSGLINVTEEETWKEREAVPKKRRKSTGRPIGRPKRKASSSLDRTGRKEDQGLTKKRKRQKLKRARDSDEESEDELINSEADFYSEEEEEERSNKVAKSSSRTRGRQNDSDSDPDFDPEELTN